jgi:hypothetical protein
MIIARPSFLAAFQRPASSSAIDRTPNMAIRRGVIDSEGFDIMQKAMDRACVELAISETDQSNRERVAFLVAGFMRAGENGVEQLTSYVVNQFRIST